MEGGNEVGGEYLEIPTTMQYYVYRKLRNAKYGLWASCPM